MMISPTVSSPYPYPSPRDLSSHVTKPLPFRPSINTQSNTHHHINHFALDIGGSLAKLVYYVDNNNNNSVITGNNDIEVIKEQTGSGMLHFIKFETTNIEDCLNFIIDNKLHLENGKPRDVRVTGGGAYKYAELFEMRLGCNLIKEDEMLTLIIGTNYLLRSIPNESFSYSPVLNSPMPKQYAETTEHQFPYLLVQVGSGVSVIKVDSETSFQRVDGTSLGGGTFWGLCSLLTGSTNFDEMVDLTIRGNNRNVDLAVGDIYGTDYSKIGLSAEAIASSFGKVIHQKDNNGSFRKEDIAHSLLKMISNNIGQIAYLNSKIHCLHKIYFGGFFIRDNPVTMQRISCAIDFWSKGKTKAMFLQHDGYLGALGAFVSAKQLDKVAQDPASSANV
ncbi:hypothetical protein SAMD00019534_106720, partial [Acytostelium subglobosum LB1]|uniref:hypothetical protein n=1 Tax=Acytostelium subglobosum LB1 TaxID=1410327 RepID=UPI00064512E9